MILVISTKLKYFKGRKSHRKEISQELVVTRVISWLSRLSFCDYLLSDLLRHLVTATLKTFLKRKSLSYFSLKAFSFWVHFFWKYHCVKCVRIQRYFGPYFPGFTLNTERYGVFLRVQSECGKIRTRVAPNMDTFYAVPNAYKHTQTQLWEISKHILSILSSLFPFFSF